MLNLIIIIIIIIIIEKKIVQLDPHEFGWTSVISCIRSSVRLRTAVLAFAFAFGWSHDTIYGPANLQKMHKQYFDLLKNTLL